MGNLIIPEGANNFITDVLENKTSIITENNAYQSVNSVKERQNRLTTNNLIFGSSFESIITVKKNLLDETFFQIQWKLSLIGSLLNEILSPLKLRRMKMVNMK